MAFSGALVGKGSAQSIPNATLTAVSLDTAEYDTDTSFSAANPTRLTVPTGFSHAKVVCSIDFAAGSGQVTVLIAKNGVTTDTIGLTRFIDDFGTNHGFLVAWVESSLIEVVSGDFFEIYVEQNSGAALNVNGSNRSWASIELTQAAQTLAVDKSDLSVTQQDHTLFLQTIADEGSLALSGQEVELVTVENEVLTVENVTISLSGSTFALDILSGIDKATLGLTASSIDFSQTVSAFIPVDTIRLALFSKKIRGVDTTKVFKIEGTFDNNNKTI